MSLSLGKKYSTQAYQVDLWIWIGAWNMVHKMQYMNMQLHECVIKIFHGSHYKNNTYLKYLSELIVGYLYLDFDVSHS